MSLYFKKTNKLSITWLLVSSLVFGFFPVTSSAKDNRKNSPSTETTSSSAKINNGNPVPKMKHDKGTKDFIKQRIAEEALAKHGKNYAASLDSYDTYADGLAKTLSQLTDQEQSQIIYGG